MKIPSGFDAGAFKLISLGAARLVVVTCISSSASVVFKGSLEQLLPAFSHNVQEADWLLNSLHLKTPPIRAFQDG